MNRFVPGRAGSLGLVLLALAATGLPALAAPAVAPGSGSSLYVKKNTWTETMLATRANLVRYQQEEEKQVGAGAKPFVSDPVAGGGPAQHVVVNVAGCRWLRLVSVLEGGGGNCHVWGEARLVAKSGAETRLSSLRPFAVSVGWGKLLADKNWQNHPLCVNKREFKHGIWIHANSDVCYRIDGRYERFEAWAGIDDDRPSGVSRFKVFLNNYDPMPVIWKQVQADFPRQAAWLTQDMGRTRELQWLGETGARPQTMGLINHALSQLGPRGATLRKQVDDLRRAKAPDNDPRWLDLYVRACRYRDCDDVLDRVWIVELRTLLEARFEPLLRADVSSDDSQWDQLAALVDRVAAKMPPGQVVPTDTTRASIDLLARALPGRFTGADRLAAELEASQKRWKSRVPAMAAGDPSALEQLPALAAEVNASRHALLAALRGMGEFLAVPANAAMEREWERQYVALRADLANRGQFERVASETFRREALILEGDRDPADVVLRRTAALLADLKRTAAAPALAALEQELAAVQKAAAAIDPKEAEARYALFADACRLRRQIALSNPLLSFERILFIKRHRSLYNHMCDQYYGMAATPGGGVYVLSGAFGPNPQLRDVLADATVERKDKAPSPRLAGQKLRGGPNTPPPLRFDGMGNVHGPEAEGGSFLSPDLSYDGKTVLFAYVECKGDPNHRHHTDPAQGHWAEGRCYHVFKVNVDGTHLEQLTDGTWNDFDPCWLPNGRIAFISERRGGYLRCGRVCPTYTLFDMAGDGSDITCLSFHETNEWAPSVTNDGQIIWTRWDYVDRHGCTAHMPWLTTLDGRDPRAVHGNFTPRHSRPDMELDCRAIPGSVKFVATAAPHHGQAYGSLVLVNPKVPDDDGMAPVRRITPEVGFPESQGGAQVYGTPWPLSEDYYLCVYDASMQPGAGFQGAQFAPGNYGIYLADSWGNKELIYRDPEIACLSPIPLRPRTMPRIAPELAKRGPETNPAARPTLPPRAKEPQGTVALVNVYESIKPWPKGTKIKELRVLQVLPMSVPSGGPPHNTGLRIASAGDSVVPIRYVLGTVPVEEDGSAQFTVPADREIFFQALGPDGLAVQSMRSATYLHEGERLVCAGCHEPKYRSAPSLTSVPAAFRRAPSRLKPDVDGSNPFSYPRLVQPVLDRHCVKCHAEKADKAPNLAREPIANHWYASYNSLAQRYGFHDYGDPYRTTPGQFGARASGLYKLLQKGHYDVKLSPEEFHRLMLWLDCSSMFYGVYEREGGEAQLRGEVARPTLE